MTFVLNGIWTKCNNVLLYGAKYCCLSFSLSLPPSVFLCLLVSWLSVHLPVCPSAHHFVCFSVSLCVFFPIFYSLSLHLALPVYLALYFSLNLPVYVSLSLSPSFSVFTSPPHSFHSYSPSLISNLSFRFSVFLSVERFIENFPLHVEIFIFSLYRSFYQDPIRQTNSKSISSVCLRGHSVLSSLNCTGKNLDRKFLDFTVARLWSPHHKCSENE